MPTPSWTEGEVDRLKSLVQLGRSYGQIGSDLGKTRGAVSGKLDRLGLKSASGLKGGRQMHGPKKPKAKRKRPFKINTTPLPKFEPGPAPTAFICHLADLTAYDCRWPMWDDRPTFMYCGAPTIEGKSYCAAHCRMAWKK